MQSPRVAQQWERGGRAAARPVRRPARARACSGSCRSSTACRRWIDQRTITTSFAAEQTLTSDTVPVNVDAVLFWMVHDAQKAALEVQDYAQAVSWAAQTALRDIIGRTTLDRSAARPRADRSRAAAADRRSGRTRGASPCQSVEMRDVVIPGALQDAMSREAQAAREKQARIILGEAEMEIAHSFEEAAKSYHDNPTALHLRAMNMLYEGLKEKGALMLDPEQRRRVDGHGRPDGRGRAAAADAHRRRKGGVAMRIGFGSWRRPRRARRAVLAQAPAGSAAGVRRHVGQGEQLGSTHEAED